MLTDLLDPLQPFLARHTGVALWAATLGAFLGAWVRGLRGAKIAAETELVRQNTAKIAADNSHETVSDMAEQMDRYREELSCCRRECADIEKRAAAADRRAMAAELRVLDIEAVCRRLETRCRAIEDIAARVGIDLSDMMGEAS